MNEESKHPAIEPELEARIVALVLGEASDFEREELNRLIELRPELAAFKLRMEGVHGLLQNVGAGEFEAPAGEWKLPADRRNAVLATIRGEAIANENVASLAGGGVSALRAESSTQPLPGQSGPGTENQHASGPEGRNNVCIDPSGLTQGIPDHRWLTPPAEVVSAHSGLNPGTSSFARRVRKLLTESLGPFAFSVSRRMRKTPTKIAAGVCVVGLVGLMALPWYFSDEKATSDQLVAMLWVGERYDREPMSGETSLSFGTNPLGPREQSDFRNSTRIEGAVSERFHQYSEAEDRRKSEVALSAIQDTLRSHAIPPRDTSFSDDIESLYFESESRTLDEAVAQINVRTWQRQDRPTATFESAPTSKPKSDDSPSFIANNRGELPDAIFMMQDGNGDGPVNLIPNSPSDLSVRVVSPEDNFDRQMLGFTSPTESKGDIGQLFSGATESWAESLASAPSVRRLLTLPDGRSFDGQSPVGVDFDFNIHDVEAQTSVPELAQGQKQSGEGKDAGRELSKNRIAAPADGSDVEGEKFGNELNSMGTVDLADTSERASEPTDMSVFGRGGRALGRSAGESPTAASNLGMGDDGVNPLWNKSSKEIAADAEGIADKKKEDVAHFDDSPPVRLARTKAAAGRDQNKAVAAVELPVVDGFNSSFSSTIESPAEESSPLNELEKFGNAAGADSDEEGFKKQSEAKPGSSSVAINSGKTPELFFHGMLTPRLANGTWSDKPAENGKPLLSYHSGNHFFVPSDELVELQRISGDVKGSPHVFYRQFRYVAPMLEDDSKSMNRPMLERIEAPAGLDEKTAAEEAFSTFSLHVSDVSFKLALATLAHGEWPDTAKIRIEEFVNAFDYGDPMPCHDEKVACSVEQSIHPFVQQRNLLRISMRTAAAGRASNTPLRLTFLLDNSGSMERTDRQQTVRRAFSLLAEQLTPIDQVTLISFARQPRLLADKVSGADAGKLVGLIDELPSEGGTNIEAALQLAFEKAREQQTPGAQNRIILLTDGAVNLGNADPESLSHMVTTMRSTGIAFDAAGISAEGLNDEVLEALTRKGDGRYYLLDSIDDADDGFARQIAGALRPSAKNVKVQVEFNPKRVGRYKLLGFEKHILKTEDFRNDTVDAAEMAAAEAGVAMYQFEAKPDGEGDVGSVSVRFLDLSTGEMIENRWPIPYEADAPRPDHAAPSLRIATSAAMLAAKLRGEPLGEAVDLQALSHLMSGLPEQDRNDSRVQQLQQMIEQARQLSGK